MTVPLNTPTTIDLAPFITGTPTGITIVTGPARGTVTVNGTRVTFTPINNFFGSDTFSYAAINALGTSAPGTVTVTISGRPDPARDASIAGLVAAQAETALRFSQTQISNFQRRMETLHRGGGADPAAARSGGRNPDLPAAVGSSGAMPALTAGPANLGDINRDRAAAGSPAQSSGISGLWIEGNTSFGSYDGTSSRDNLDFSTTGISFGQDRWFGDQLALGIGVGYAHDKTDIGTNVAQSRASEYSATFYGSYQPQRNVFVDGLIGVGHLNFATQRVVVPANDFARSDRDGHQVFGSLAAGYEHHRPGLLVSPYARLDYSATRLDQATEGGPGQFALTYFKQTTTSLQSALGLRAETAHATNFGWIVPRMRLEYRHEFADERFAPLAYADLAGGPRSALSVGPLTRDALAIGIGSDLVLRDGVTIGLDYQMLRSSESASHAFRVRLLKELDGPGATAATRVTAAPSPEPLDIKVDVGYMLDDNVTRSRAPSEMLSDQVYSVNVSKVASVSFTEKENIRGLIAGSVSGEKFRNYGGLSRVSVGGSGELQYRPSAEFFAPVAALFGRLFVDQYQSELRDGYRTSVGVSLRQPVTDRLELFGAVAHNERYADSSVFTTRDNSGRLNLDLSLGQRSTLYLGAEYRRGDIVSTGSPRLEDVDIAKVLVADDAFPGKGFFAYKFEGRTWIGTLGYNVPLGAQDSLDFSWRRAEATPSQRPAFATSPSSYIVNQYSIVYLTRF